ncbi:MAG: hypothetical protein C0418_05255 [Coriobacteriaceae bacterium]|nr:hypothetical protein [Coriobacteriaceae bacterium]
MGVFGRKVTIEDGPAGLVVTVPVRGMGCAAVFIAFWLVGWTAGEFAALWGLAETGLRPTAESMFLVVWLVAWTVGGAFAWGVMLFAFAGREVVTVTDTRLTSRVEALRIGRTTVYELRGVRHLRIEKGRLLFHYDGSNVRIGSGLDAEHATQVLDAMLAKRPELGRDWHAWQPTDGSAS